MPIPCASAWRMPPSLFSQSEGCWGIRLYRTERQSPADCYLPNPLASSLTRLIGQLIAAPYSSSAQSQARGRSAELARCFLMSMKPDHAKG